MAGVAYGLVWLSVALTVLVFVLVYVDARALSAPDDAEGRAQARRVVFWVIVFWPVGFYLLARLRRQARLRQPAASAE
ncbi:MAG: hypothetical protein ACRDYW_11725 [Acidimicrobiales bacterium]